MSELSDTSIINRLNINDDSNYKNPNDALNNNDIDEWLYECNIDIYNTNTIMVQCKYIYSSTLMDENPPNSLRWHNRLCYDD